VARVGMPKRGKMPRPAASAVSGRALMREQINIPHGQHPAHGYSRFNALLSTLGSFAGSACNVSILAFRGMTAWWPAGNLAGRGAWLISARSTLTSALPSLPRDRGNRSRLAGARAASVETLSRA